MMVMAQPEGAWYLRGDIGVGITNQFDVTYLPSPPDVGNGFVVRPAFVGDSVFFDAGVGYELNSWLRFDVTGGYRDRTQVNARGIYNRGHRPRRCLSRLSAVLGRVLANAYVDFGTWDCLTPFLGVGIGGAYNQMADLVDMGIGTTGARLRPQQHQLESGLCVLCRPRLQRDQEFHRSNCPTAISITARSPTRSTASAAAAADSYKFSNLSSNDFMLGMRWRFPIDTGTTFVQAQPAPVMVQQPRRSTPSRRRSISPRRSISRAAGL